MDSKKEDFSPTIWEGVIGGRYIKSKKEYLIKYQGIKFFFKDDMFIIRSINYRHFMAIDSSKLKNMPDIEELRTMYSYEDDMNNSLDNRLKKAKENNIKVKCLH